MDESRHVDEFRERCRYVWLASRRWLLVMLSGFAICLFAVQWVLETRWFIVGMSLAGIGIAGVTYIVSTYYRCPACERVPSDSEGIHLWPSRCVHCGARLR